MTFYFDNAATTRVKQEVFKEMVPYFTEQYGNPSSLYHIGRTAKKAIEEAREKVANLINANKNEIYFTGCGSESDNTALKGIAYAKKAEGNHIITTKIEHPAILDSCSFLEKQGFDITYLNVDSQGFIDLAELENAITDKTILISIMFANNEIGTIEPIEQISQIAKKRNIIFHTDAVQATGNVHIDVKKMGIDMLSMSGHKVYGPKGIGALYVRKGIEFEKFMNGGHQEKNKRAGTENLAEIVGIGKACELAQKNLDSHIENMKNLKNYFISKIEENFTDIAISESEKGNIANIATHKAEIGNITNISTNKIKKESLADIKINGPKDETKRLPGTCNISFKNVDGMALLLELDKKGICVSTGSACSSGDTAPSHVLTSIGLEPEFAKGTIRFTFGEFNQKWEIDYLINSLKEIIPKVIE